MLTQMRAYKPDDCTHLTIVLYRHHLIRLLCPAPRRRVEIATEKVPRHCPLALVLWVLVSLLGNVESVKYLSKNRLISPQITAGWGPWCGETERMLWTGTRGSGTHSTWNLWKLILTPLLTVKLDHRRGTNILCCLLTQLERQKLSFPVPYPFTKNKDQRTLHCTGLNSQGYELWLWIWIFPPEFHYNRLQKYYEQEGPGSDLASAEKPPVDVFRLG